MATKVALRDQLTSAECRAAQAEAQLRDLQRESRKTDLFACVVGFSVFALTLAIVL